MPYCEDVVYSSGVLKACYNDLFVNVCVFLSVE